MNYWWNKNKIKSGYETQSEVQLPKEDAFDFREPVKSYFDKIQIVQDKSKFTEKELDKYGGSMVCFIAKKNSEKNYFVIKQVYWVVQIVWNSIKECMD